MDKKTLFVISSDFCHWGDHFDYKPMLPGFKENEIYKCICELDTQAMNLIQAQDMAGFQKYLKETENTICGSKPIQVLMACIDASGKETETKFVKYDQSEKLTSPDGSSVSYASSYTLMKH